MMLKTDLCNDPTCTIPLHWKCAIGLPTDLLQAHMHNVTVPYSSIVIHYIQYMYMDSTNNGTLLNNNPHGGCCWSISLPKFIIHHYCSHYSISSYLLTVYWYETVLYCLWGTGFFPHSWPSIQHKQSSSSVSSGMFTNDAFIRLRG